MKTILFFTALLFLSLIVVACVENSVDSKLVCDDWKTVGKIFKVEIEGHTYLIRNHDRRGGICHDANCHCRKENREVK